MMLKKVHLEAKKVLNDNDVLSAWKLLAKNNLK
jgi:hypothetical protein